MRRHQASRLSGRFIRKSGRNPVTALSTTRPPPMRRKMVPAGLKASARRRSPSPRAKAARVPRQARQGTPVATLRRQEGGRPRRKEVTLGTRQRVTQRSDAMRSATHEVVRSWDPPWTKIRRTRFGASTRRGTKGSKDLPYCRQGTPWFANGPLSDPRNELRHARQRCPTPWLERNGDRHPPSPRPRGKV